MSFDESELVVGIDLGTTNSAIAYYRDDQIKILENKEGSYTTPSFVCFSSANEATVGKNAKRMSRINPDLGIYEIKRLLGRQFHEVENNLQHLLYKVENQFGSPVINLEKFNVQKTPEEISCDILRKLKEDASDKLGVNISKAVITVPAHFSVSQRKATLEAAKMAGFTVLKLLNEPTAAALNYFHDQKHQLDKKRYCLIFDLGGGTFDVAILRQAGPNIDVVATDGDSYLGGHNFDQLITNYVISYLQKNHNFDTNSKNFKRDLRRLNNDVVEAKEALSSSKETSITYEGLHNDESCEINLTRHQFESMANHLFERTIEIVDRCLKSTSLSKNDIDDIILAGGSTHIPKIQELLRNYFNGKSLDKGLHPEECVAKGAALQAAMLSKDPQQKVKEFKITEVTSSSLGIAKVANRMKFVIKKNTPIPFKTSLSCNTVYDRQASVAFNIYEGERLDVRKNLCLGTFTITNLTPAAPGKCEIDAIMSIDDNGILTVTAQEKSKKNNVKNLALAYVRNNKPNIKDDDPTQSKAEDERFLKIANLQAFLILYCVAIDFNLKKNKLESTYMNVVDQCSKIRKTVLRIEDKEKLKSMGREILSICEPLIRKHNFEDVPDTESNRRSYFAEEEEEEDQSNDLNFANVKCEEKHVRKFIQRFDELEL